MEIFKPIPSFIGKYEIGSLGNIKALPNRTRSKERICKLGKSNAGYLLIDLWNGQHNNRLVHRIVALVFIPNPENKMQVNHKNGIKTDNRVTNLEWVTRSENQKHSYKFRLATAEGEKNSQCKLTVPQVLKIYKAKKNPYKYAQLYNISKPTISDIRSGRSWTHITNAPKVRKSKTLTD